MLLRSLEIKNFRSLERVELDGLGQFNVLIGRNNSGKSAVFGALALLNAAIRGTNFPEEIITAHDRKRSLEMRLRFDTQENERRSFFELVAPGPRQDSLLGSPLLRQIEFLFKSASGQPHLFHLRTTSLMAQDGHWATIQRLISGDQNDTPESKIVRISEVFRQEADFFDSNLLSIDHTQLFHQLGVRRDLVGGNFAFPDAGAKWFLQQLDEYLGKAFFFNPFRHSATNLPAQQSEQLTQDGSNLAQVLHTINSNDRALFSNIERFLQDALPDIGMLQAPLIGGNTEISFRAPDGNYLVRLHDMGGGIEQLLMVATVLLTTGEECSIFLEEPESHLHAGAQRFLIERLYQGERQVFLTTHSPTFVNVNRSISLYRVSYSQRRTEVNFIGDDGSLNDVLDEIGSRKSDLLLSDAVLFVEGPSDKRVFSAWSERLGKSLDEHNVTVLTMDGGEHADRKARVRSDVLIGISQRAPIPHMFVVDGDERSQAELNRLQEGLGDGLYVLQSREIENYFLLPRVLLSAIRSKYQDNYPILERAQGGSEEEVSELIRTTVDSFYGLILLKRIRAEIAGLAGGMLTRELAAGLAAEAHSDKLGKRIRDEVEARLANRLEDLNLDGLVEEQREILDVEWADLEKRLVIAPGEEIVNAVFRHFGGEYKKPNDGSRIASEMTEDEIVPEIRKLIERIVSMTGRVRSN